MSAIAAWRGTAAILLLTSGWVAGASRLALSETRQMVKVHIRLVDRMRLPEKVLLDAELTAMGIFQRSGLELDFVECQASAMPCRQPLAQGDHWLQILDQPPRNLRTDVTGFAVLVPSGRPGDSYAAISYPLVESAAKSLGVSIGDVLGASMAHEIGHLLLHASAHSRTGIMSARLDRQQIELLERGELVFTKDQIRRISKRANQFSP